jgi:hypothetical protein
VRSSLEHARKAGEMLLQAKQLCKHGEWLPWLKANVRLSQWTVSAYMRVADGWDKLETVTNLREALRLLSAESAPEEAVAGEDPVTPVEEQGLAGERQPN